MVSTGAAQDDAVQVSQLQWQPVYSAVWPVLYQQWQVLRQSCRGADLACCPLQQGTAETMELAFDAHVVAIRQLMAGGQWTPGRARRLLQLSELSKGYTAAKADAAKLP